MVRTSLLVLIAISSLTGCVAREIRYSDDMTVDRAKGIIRDYTRSVYRDSPFIVGWNFKSVELSDEQLAEEITDHEFPVIYLTKAPGSSGFSGPIQFAWNRQSAKYTDLGTFKVRWSNWSWMSPAVLFVIGPTILEIEEVGGAPFELPGRIPSFKTRCSYAAWGLNKKSVWMSYIPLWLFGTAFWGRTQDEKYLEALVFMRDHAAGAPTVP